MENSRLAGRLNKYE
jgi:hypothetical protein